jgi:hypothetical protein
MTDRALSQIPQNLCWRAISRRVCHACISLTGCPSIVCESGRVCQKELKRLSAVISCISFAVQCVAIIVSTANHLGKSDLYFTMLGAAIRWVEFTNA